MPLKTKIICKESKDNAYNKYTFILNKAVIGMRSVPHTSSLIAHSYFFSIAMVRRSFLISFDIRSFSTGKKLSCL